MSTRPQHNHTTRSLEPEGVCPACDATILANCTCPRGDLKLGRLDGFDMGIKRNARLSASKTCVIHQGQWLIPPRTSTDEGDNHAHAGCVWRSAMRRLRKAADDLGVVDTGSRAADRRTGAVDGLLTDVEAFEVSDPVKQEIRKREQR